MGFGGSVAAMITSLKNNKRDRKTAFDKDGHRLNSTFGELIDHKKMTPEAFEVFKLKLKKEKNAAQRKQIIIILATLLILAFLFLGMPYLF